MNRYSRRKLAKINLSALLAASWPIEAIAQTAGTPTQLTIGAVRPAFGSTTPPVVCITAGNACVADLGSFAGGKFVPSPAWLGAPNGAASLDSTGKALPSQLPINTAGGVVGVGGPIDTNTVTATGGTAARTNAARAADALNVRDYGAKCDDITDDSAAFNSAIAVVRSKQYGTVSWAGCKALITHPINLTGIISYNVTIEAVGSMIDCRMSGGTCLDAYASAHFRIRDLNIQGSCSSVPQNGMAKGRLAFNDGYGGEFSFENPTIQGCFTLAAMYNFSGETDYYSHPTFNNNYNTGSCYALIQDAYNMFGVTSTFQSVTAQAGQLNSFNENFFVSPTIYTGNGSTCAPVWLGGTHRHSFHGGYIANFNSTGHEVVLYSASNNITNTDLDMESHFETSPSDIFFVTGPGASPVIDGLRYKDHLVQATGSIFATDTGISSLTVHRLDLHVASFLSSPNTFSAPSTVTADGVAEMPAANWNLPTAAFSGALNLGGKFSFLSANLPNSYGTGLVLANGVLSVSLPTSLNVNKIAPTGGVQSVAISNSAAWSIPAGGALFPTININAPQDASGTQASVQFKALLLNSLGSVANGGSGYAVGDVFSPVGGTTTDQASKFKVTSIGTGGAITGFTPAGSGHYSSLITDTSSVATTAVTGSGSGATFHGVTWIMATNDVAANLLSVVASGSGYSSATATFSNPSGVTLTGGSPSLTINLGNSLTLLGGGFGQVLLDGTGAKLGTSGSSGSPAIAQGALIDASGVRVGLTGNYTVPANTSLVRFTQTSNVTSTVTLPTAIADGQPIQFVNQGAGAVALTFSPAVQGWSNGATLAAGPGVGLRVRWDATAAAWFREQ